MKALFAACLLMVSTFVYAADNSSALSGNSSVVTGEVLEVKNVEIYSYLRLQTKDGEVWAAVIKAPVKQGASVTIENVVVMHDFWSKSLNRSFQTILFGSIGGADASTAAAPVMNKAHSNLPKIMNTGDVHVAKASGEYAMTVAEIMTKGAQLKEKQVLVRGRVVKYNPDIMGKNWLHLRDGSGSEADESNDILVTSKQQAKLGEVVTVKGIVRTDKDFGAGYAYRVLIEEATLQ